FADRIGGLMTDQVRWLPAALFYMGYLAGVLYLVSLPALKSGMPVQALLGGMVLGAVAYGTYEFTNYAILRDWHWQMVVSDTVWGAVLTGLSAWGGLLITRAVAP
ncbi:MAG: DUF2177 family protein, partial [Paracoccaceae bacterium]|nr:DUF2177 family protein [Paracoccaceae bacterium]